MTDEADWDEADLDPVEDLSPETIEGVARRLRLSTTFVARVYRESEMDALWSLADIALAGMGESQWRGEDFPPRPELPKATAEDFRGIADRIFLAHDVNAEGDYAQAADLLMEVAARCRALES